MHLLLFKDILTTREYIKRSFLMSKTIYNFISFANSSNVYLLIICQFNTIDDILEQILCICHKYYNFFDGYHGTRVWEVVGKLISGKSYEQNDMKTIRVAMVSIININESITFIY